MQPHFCDSMISPLEYEHFQLVITILQHPFDYSFHSYFCNHLHFHVISVTSFILKLKLNLCDSRPGSTQVSCKNPHKPACAAIAKIWTTCKTSYMLALRWVIFSCLVDWQAVCTDLDSVMIGLYFPWIHEPSVGMTPKKKTRKSSWWNEHSMGLNVYMNTWLFCEKSTWSINPFYWSK